MNSSCSWRNESIWTSFEALIWFKSLHVCMFFIFLKMGLNMVLIDSPVGLEFINWALNLVIHWILWCFPEFGPKRSSLEWLNAWFELGRQIWKFQIWRPRSSEGFLARASTFVQGSARATIERPSRVKIQQPVLLLFCRPRERRIPRSSDAFDFGLTLERRKARSSEALIFSKVRNMFSKCIFASSFHPRHS